MCFLDLGSLRETRIVNSGALCVRCTTVSVAGHLETWKSLGIFKVYNREKSRKIGTIS